MSAYPLFLRLEGKRVLVVGAGAVGGEHAAKLARAGASVVVVAPNALPSAVHESHAREVRDDDLDGAWLVIAAATPAVNRRVRASADARRIFVIAVDDSASCSAFGAARLDRGGITVALSSDGRAPALVSLLRQALDVLLPQELDAWRAVAERVRAEQRAHGVAFHERRPRVLEALVGLYTDRVS